MIKSTVMANLLRLLAGGLCVLPTSLQAQSVVNLPTQSRNADFSAFPRTRPIKTGTVVPATCQTGDLFFKSDAAAGQNIFGCVAPDVWIGQGSGGGGTPGSTAGVVGVTLTSPTTLSIGASCSVTIPCNTGVGSTVYSLVSGAVVSLAGGTGNAYIYIASDGSLTVGHNLTLSCSAACVASPGITGFPADAVPVAIWAATNGAWAATGGDVRAVLNKDFIRIGLGLISVSGNYQQISVDQTIVPTRVTVPPTSTSSCVSSSWAADTAFLYICVAPSTWRRVATTAW